MKARLLPQLSVAALLLTSAFAQPQPEPPRQVPSRPVSVAGQNQSEAPKLTTFSLDFPGGTPRQLITAIEKALGKPVNAIIPPEHTDVKLPPLKMAQVNVSQLFEALELASHKTEAYFVGNHPVIGGYGSYQQSTTSYGFRTQGARSDDSIWYFYVEKPSLPPPVTPSSPKVCRFYALTSYLESGLTVDDITTAIQTGWKMLGDQETPAISFHKETKLLIAVGEQSKLETIDAVLKALAPKFAPTPGEEFTERLQSFMRKPGASNSPPAAPKAAEKPKTEN